MRPKLVPLLALLLSLTACATTIESKITIPQAVQKKSYADQQLFADVMTQGIARAELKFFPDAQKRELTDIEPIVPYDNQKTGIERWTLTHNGQGTCSYIVKFIPDGHGGTTFSVQKEYGKTKPSAQ